MTESEAIWGKSWGNLNWKKVTPAEIDAHIAKGADVNLVRKIKYPLGYENTNPLLESLKADNPVAFAHLIQRGADLNFRLPYANLYPEGARHGNHSVVADAPKMLYVKYATQKGMKVLPEYLLDVESNKGPETERKLSFLLDVFEKRKNSKECLSVLRILPRFENTKFLVQHFSSLLENIDTRDVLEMPEDIRTDRVLKRRMLQTIRRKEESKKSVSQKIKDTQRIKD